MARAALSVVAAVPGISQLFGLAAAVWQALADERASPSREFAYAAYARSAFKASNQRLHPTALRGKVKRRG